MASYDESKLSEWIHLVESVARDAGALIQDMFSKPKSSSVIIDKTVASIDLVTDTDKACEKLIFSELRKHFPDFTYIGEETASDAGSYSLTDAPTFIIDPVDGTTNAVHRAPDVAVSIGLAVNKQPVLGVVYDPIRDECFKAWKNGGSYLNGRRIQVDSEPQELIQAIVSMNIGYLRDETSVNHITGTIRNLMAANLRALRMNGSACNQITSVACGRASCFVESGPHAWDVCAAAVIVQEAGGVAYDMKGRPLNLYSRNYLFACNEAIAQLVLKTVVHPLPIEQS